MVLNVIYKERKGLGIHKEENNYKIRKKGELQKYVRYS